MRPVNALMILDGFGLSAVQKGNCIIDANIPNIKQLRETYASGQLGASGMAVGLPDGQMGNSEVGHLNIGAGRVVYQEFTRITKSIKDGDFYENQAFLAACSNVKKNGTKLHLIGLVSDGGVHSHIDHIVALVELAKRQGLDDVFVHCLMDGRDTPPSSGKDYIIDLEKSMGNIGIGSIATVSGRYYGMDRDNRWDRVRQAWEAMVLGRGSAAASAVAAMEQSYAEDKTDEFVPPTVITRNGAPVATISEGDSIIFFNFRPDRAREITSTFIDPKFDGFEREGGYRPVFYVSMTQYDINFNDKLMVAFNPQTLTNTLGEYLAVKGKTQLRIAETEKYAHVTFFFNGGVEKPNEGEDRILIPSPKVATYDMKPEMSAYEVTEKAVDAILSGKYDVMILNFANCDMVGHTGKCDATTKAVKTVDECTKKVVDAILQTGGNAIITADHGNADRMVDLTTGEPFTAHTTNPVPVIVAGLASKGKVVRDGGILADLAPTLLDIMGLEKPAEMTGTTLLK